ncbi:hypothetical protein G9A89_023026 [Geosiphon pyriformis]|nr:hypothetical protein G9A89_023026 [Geosiphon pyriformis]
MEELFRQIVKSTASIDTCHLGERLHPTLSNADDVFNGRDLSSRKISSRYDDRRISDSYVRESYNTRDGRDKYDRDERYLPPPPLDRGYDRPTYDRYGREPDLEYRREYRSTYDRGYERERDRAYDRTYPDRDYERYSRDNYDRTYYPPPRDGYERDGYERRPLPPPDVTAYPARGRTGSPPPPPPPPRRASYERNGIRDAPPSSYRGRSPPPPATRYTDSLLGPPPLRPPSPRASLYRRRSLSPLRNNRPPPPYSGRPRSPSPIRALPPRREIGHKYRLHISPSEWEYFIFGINRFKSYLYMSLDLHWHFGASRTASFIEFAMHQFLRLNSLRGFSLHQANFLLVASSCEAFPSFSKTLFTSSPLLSGHNKWSKIRHNKGAKDAQRAVQFSKIAKEIELAVKLGNSTDPVTNVRLSAALSTARKANVPKDNIETAIKKGAGQGKDQNSIESITYEGYGPGGVAFIIEALTDNRNRTVKALKNIFSRYRGSMSNVAWMFEKKGKIQFSKGNTKDTIDSMMENALEISGVEDIEELEDGILEISCSPNTINGLSEQLRKKYNYEVNNLRAGYVPNTTTIVGENEELETTLSKFINALNDNEDVVEIYSNAE